jgi:hypothetical protein
LGEETIRAVLTTSAHPFVWRPLVQQDEALRLRDSALAERNAAIAERDAALREQREALL